MFFFSLSVFFPLSCFSFLLFLVPRRSLKDSGMKHNLMLAFFFGMWLFGATSSTIINKLIVDHFHSPVLLSQSHLLFTTIADLAIILIGSRKKKRNLFSASITWAAFPISVAMTLCKTMTYASYGLISPSLTQTIKASAPIFTVFLLSLYGQQHNSRVFITLLPISAGVAIAALTEININVVGLHLALASSFAQVRLGQAHPHLPRRKSTKESSQQRGGHPLSP